MAVSSPQHRTNEIFSVISKSAEYSFKSIKSIPGAVDHGSLVKTACSEVEYARILLEIEPSIVNREILDVAAGSSGYWLNYYTNKFPELMGTLEDDRSRDISIQYTNNR